MGRPELCNCIRLDIVWYGKIQFFKTTKLFHAQWHPEYIHSALNCTIVKPKVPIRLFKAIIYKHHISLYSLFDVLCWWIWRWLWARVHNLLGGIYSLVTCYALYEDLQCLEKRRRFDAFLHKYVLYLWCVSSCGLKRTVFFLSIPEIWLKFTEIILYYKIFKLQSDQGQ